MSLPSVPARKKKKVISQNHLSIQKEFQPLTWIQARGSFVQIEYPPTKYIFSAWTATTDSFWPKVKIIE